MNNLNKGFTLVELLTVIAIIGILSSIVLSSLTTAKSKGSNSSIKSNMNQLRAQATIYYDTPAGLGGPPTVPNSYEGICADVQSLSQRFVDSFQAAHANSSAPSGNIRYTSAFDQTANPTYSVCHNDNTSWAASVPLKVPEVISGTTYNFFCVDYRGFSGVRVLGLGASAMNCPAS